MILMVGTVKIFITLKFCFDDKKLLVVLLSNKCLHE